MSRFRCPDCLRTNLSFIAGNRVQCNYCLRVGTVEDFTRPLPITEEIRRGEREHPREAGEDRA